MFVPTRGSGEMLGVMRLYDFMMQLRSTRTLIGGVGGVCELLLFGGLPGFNFLPISRANAAYRLRSAIAAGGEHCVV